MIPPKKLYLNRRQFIASSAALAASGLWGPDPAGGTLEIRIQERKIHCQDQVRRKMAPNELEAGQLSLCQCQPECGPPRWSQAKERRLGVEGKHATLMFNGYADEVSHLYSGMDLKKNF